MELTNRDFTLDNEEIQHSRQGELPPFPLNNQQFDSVDKDEEILLESKPKISEGDRADTVDDLKISGPMKLRLKELGFSSLKQLQKETTASLIMQGMKKRDATDTSNAMNRIGMTMPKSKWGELSNVVNPKKKAKLRPIISLDEDEELPTLLDGLGVTGLIKDRLRKAGLKRLDQIQKESVASLIRRGLSKWDAQIISAAMFRLGYKLQKKQVVSPSSKTPQKLNRNVSGTKLKTHWTQTPEGRKKMSQISSAQHQKKDKILPEILNTEIWKRLAKYEIDSISQLLALSATELKNKIGPSPARTIIKLLAKKNLYLRVAPRRRQQNHPVQPKKEIALGDLNPTPKMWELLQAAKITDINTLLQKSRKEMCGLIGEYFTNKLSHSLYQKDLYFRESSEANEVEEEVELVSEFLGEKRDVRKEEYIGYIIGYAHSDILQRISVLAESTGGQVSEAELASRLGRLLQGEKMR